MSAKIFSCRFIKRINSALYKLFIKFCLDKEASWALLGNTDS